MPDQKPKIDITKLANYLLCYRWQRNCRVVVDKTKPVPWVLVYCPEREAYLRFSKGPIQGYFWDVYGDNFEEVELALLGLSKSGPPGMVDGICLASSSDKLDLNNLIAEKWQ